MAQVSYGTITITDTTDIERIYPVYCRGGEDNAPALLPLTNWKEDISQITTTGDYIWQRIVAKKNGIALVAEDYSDAVRLTGIDGVDIVSITVTYCNHNYNDDNHKPTSGGHSGWQTNVPSYDSTYKYYWVKTTITYSEGEPSVLIRYDAGLSEANANAAIANSIATHANEDAHGAMSQVTATQYELEALDAKLKYFFWPGDSNYPGVYAASGISGTTFNEGSISTYGYNVAIKPASIGIGYNNITAILIDGSNPSLKFYAPSKTKQAANPSMELTSSALIFNKIGTANKSVELTDSALNFYGSSTSTPDATLNSNGLKLTKGGIEAGSYSSSTTNFIYLSSNDYSGSTITINGNSSGWRQIIGSKFGVKNDGTLYANNAVISGQITVGPGSDLSDGLGDYSTTTDMNTAIGNATNNKADKTDTVKSVSTETQYRLSNSSTSLTGSGTGYSWSTTIPTWSANKYLWTRIATTYTPITGSAVIKYTPGVETNDYGIYDSQLTTALSTAAAAQTTANGAAASVVTTQQYNLSSSTSSANGTWQNNIPTWTANKYIWVRFQIVTTPMSGTASTSYTPNANGIYDSALTTALSTADNAAPKSSAISEEQRIYYRSYTDSKPTGNGLPPTNTWVTNNINIWNENNTTSTVQSGTQTGWTTKITPITKDGITGSKKYLYLWTCIQKKTVSGSITYGDILLDDSTTVIDGGKIITGSIAANRLDVYDANISKIRADAIDVSSIQIGQSQVTNLSSTLATKASINAEYSVEIITSNFNPAATSGNLITLTAKVTRIDGGSISGLSYKWYGDNIEINGATSATYNVPYNTSYNTFTVEIN